MWDVFRGEKIVLISVLNFLKKVIPIDEYTLYGIGGGGELIKVSKNDGKIVSTVHVGGSFINDFDILDIK
jgi:hypothetical protein